MIDIKDMNYEPNMEEMSALINNPLFAELCQHLENEYKALCKIEYSKDVWLRGWNIKFKKQGNHYARSIRRKIILLCWWWLAIKKRSRWKICCHKCPGRFGKYMLKQKKGMDRDG